MNCGDAYQRLITLANAPKDDVGDFVVEFLAELRSLAAHGITLTQFLDDGRREYLTLLGARGRHHQKLAATYAAGLGIVAPYSTEQEQQSLRDFYHNAYYAAFYIARYGLVTINHYDCNEHKSICGVLDKKEKELRKNANPSNSFETFADRLLVNRLTMEGQRREQGHKNEDALIYRRNVADYVMNMKRLNIISNADQIRDFIQKISKLYTDWTVP